MKYKIEIIGHGVDCYVHKIDENQLRNLIDNEIESGMTSILEISDILSIDDSLDTELVHTGFYSDSGSYIIRVTCDDKVLDFEDYDFNDYDYSSIYRDDNYLIISDVIKGNIFNYDIEIDGEFDIEKLKPTILDICEDLDIIVDFTYNGESLIKEWGDYYSKGFDYYICEI